MHERSVGNEHLVEPSVFSLLTIICDVLEQGNPRVKPVVCAWLRRCASAKVGIRSHGHVHCECVWQLPQIICDRHILPDGYTYDTECVNALLTIICDVFEYTKGLWDSRLL